MFGVKTIRIVNVGVMAIFIMIVIQKSDRNYPFSRTKTNSINRKGFTVSLFQIRFIDSLPVLSNSLALLHPCSEISLFMNKRSFY